MWEDISGQKIGLGLNSFPAMLSWEQFFLITTHLEILVEFPEIQIAQVRILVIY